VTVLGFCYSGVTEKISWGHLALASGSLVGVYRFAYSEFESKRNQRCLQSCSNLSHSLEKSEIMNHLPQTQLLLIISREQCCVGTPSRTAPLFRTEPSRLRELNLQLVKLLPTYSSRASSPLDLLSKVPHNRARIQDDLSISKAL